MVKIVKPITKQMAKRKGGRKPAALTLTDEQLSTISSALAVGFPQSKCAALVGISEAAFSRMLKRDKSELAIRLCQAKETGKKELLDIIKQAAATSKQWAAAAWLLERSAPLEFGQMSRTSGSGSAVTINLQNVLQAQSKRGPEQSKTGNKTIDV